MKGVSSRIKCSKETQNALVFVREYLKAILQEVLKRNFEQETLKFFVKDEMVLKTKIIVVQFNTIY